MDGRKNKRRGRGYNSPNRGRGNGNGGSPAQQSPGQPPEEPLTSASSSPLSSVSTPSRPKEDPVKDSSSPSSTPSSTLVKPKEDASADIKPGSAEKPQEETTPRKTSASAAPAPAAAPASTPTKSAPDSAPAATPRTVGAAPSKPEEPKVESAKPEGSSKSSVSGGAPKEEPVKDTGLEANPKATPKATPESTPKGQGKAALEGPTAGSVKQATPAKPSVEPVVQKSASTVSAAPPKEEPVVVKSALAASATPAAPTAVKPEEPSKSAPSPAPTQNPGSATPKRDMSSSTPVKLTDSSNFQTPTAREEETFSTPRSSLSLEREDSGSTAESTPTKSATPPQQGKTPGQTPVPPPASASTSAAKSEPLRERPPTPPKASRKQDESASTSLAGTPQTAPPKRTSVTESGKFADRSVQEACLEEVAQSARKGSVGGKLGYMGSFGAGSNISTVGNVHGLTDQEDVLANRSTSSQAPSLLGFTKRQVLTLLVFSFANFFSAVIISLQAPFYPQEAEAKGATATEYGLVFGVFELVVFITSPIYGNYLQKVGPKTVFNIGIITTGVMTIAFGFLDRFEDRTVFISLSFAVRVIEAMGDAAFITASFAIIATEFPQSVATTFASLETFFGLGLIVGPTLGGALYQTGGFTLPFAVMGGLLLLVGFFAFLIMPPTKVFVEDGKKVPGGVFSILKVPGVALASFSIVAASISVGFLNATLEPHIRQFTLTPVMTGLIFVINGGLYAVTAPAWGWVCDRFTQPRIVGLLGAVSVLLGFLLIGPAPFVPLDTILWLTCLGLVIHGIGLGAMLVSSFILALRESISHGFADNIHTYGLTSALWTSSFAFGAFVGPSVGGILLDQVGFRWATVFVLAVQLLLTILLVAFIARTRAVARGFKEGNMESAPLLKSAEDPCSSKTALEKNGQDGYQKQSPGYGAV